jgi:hypothetical protein
MPNAAYHCVRIAVLTEAEKQGKPTAELEAEAQRAYEALVAALHGAGYLEQYRRVFPEYENIAGDVKR